LQSYWLLRSVFNGAKEKSMSQEEGGKTPGRAAVLSLDTWAVVLALVLALLVKLDVIRRVPW